MIFKRRSRVRIISAQKDPTAKAGERRYEIQPESYLGPWYLPPGTVLAVVSMPDSTKGTSDDDPS